MIFCEAGPIAVADPNVLSYSKHSPTCFKKCVSICRPEASSTSWSDHSGLFVQSLGIGHVGVLGVDKRDVLISLSLASAAGAFSVGPPQTSTVCAGKSIYM